MEACLGKVDCPASDKRIDLFSVNTDWWGVFHDTFIGVKMSEVITVKYGCLIYFF
jgi:hypothetical protein